MTKFFATPANFNRPLCLSQDFIPSLNIFSTLFELPTIDSIKKYVSQRYILSSHIAMISDHKKIKFLGRNISSFVTVHGQRLFWLKDESHEPTSFRNEISNFSILIWILIMLIYLKLFFFIHL